MYPAAWLGLLLQHRAGTLNRSGCTTQACDLRDNIEDLNKVDAWLSEFRVTLSLT